MAVSQQKVCCLIPQQSLGDVKKLRHQNVRLVVKEISDILCDINVGMTTDMWTDDYRKNSFLTITCHYITPDFLLRSRVLTTAMFPPEETKTGDNIRRELQHQLVSVLGFDACVMNKVVWVTDQGSNMIAALTQYHRLDCQDHVYNQYSDVHLIAMNYETAHQRSHRLYWQPKHSWDTSANKYNKPVNKNCQTNVGYQVQHCVSLPWIQLKKYTLSFVKNSTTAEKAEESTKYLQMSWSSC